MVSFPIPSRHGRPLSDLRVGDRPMGELIELLTRGKLTASTSVHLDPDLTSSTVSRESGWRAAFGQTGSAQGHLRNQGIGSGDIFLFFGWYQRVEASGESLRYAGPQIHSLFGWMQIGEVLPVADPIDLVGQRPWLRNHPHVQHAATMGVNNTIYLAADELQFGEVHTGLPGAGVFKRWTPCLQLTAPTQSCSIWDLPGWMLPANGESVLSYHFKAKAWTRIADRVRLRSVAKGQEFVLNTPDIPAARSWLNDLIGRHA